MRPGNRVQFKAETPEWSLSDWWGQDRWEAEELDGEFGRVTCVEVSDHQDEALYVDVEFDNGRVMYAVASSHLVVVAQ